MKGWRTILTQVAALFTISAAYFGKAMELGEAIQLAFIAVTVIFAALKGNAIVDAIKNGNGK